MAREKTGGRLAGTPNNSTKNIKEWIRNVVIGQQEQFERDLMMLTPRERVQAIEKLLQYVAPRMQAIEFSEDSDGSPAIALLKQMASYDEEQRRNLIPLTQGKKTKTKAKASSGNDDNDGES